MNHILRIIGSKGIVGARGLARGRTFTNLSTRSTITPLTRTLTPFRNYSSALTQDQIKHRLLSLLSSFPKATTSSTSTTDQLSASFTKDLGLDSLDVVEVVMAVEEEFGVEVPDGVADGIGCMGDLMKYLEEKLIEK